MTFDLNRRQLLGGFASLGLTALFRSKSRPSVLIEQVGEDQIIEECEAFPSAIDLVVIAQQAFRPRRLVIPTSIAPLWIIEDLSINKIGQLVGGSMPGELFSPSSFDNEMYLDVAMPQVEIRMRVRRKEGSFKPERFVGAFLGDGVGNGNGRSGSMILPINSDPYQVIP